MVREYIARDPRTGKPIQTGSRKAKEISFVPIEGPWSALVAGDAMSLAEGTLLSREAVSYTHLTLPTIYSV